MVTTVIDKKELSTSSYLLKRNEFKDYLLNKQDIYEKILMFEKYRAQDAVNYYKEDVGGKAKSNLNSLK